MLLLISLLSFLLPTQLGFHFTNFESTIYGFRIDYLIPTLYLTDILVLLMIFLGIKKFKLTRRFLIFSFLYLVFASINIYLSEYVVSNIYRWFKITEVLLLGIVVLNNKKFDVFKNFVKPLSFSIVAASALGIFQFINKGSIGGPFYYLGERSFNFIDPGIAPYPYSFFSHPNSFAGFLLVFGIFLIQHKNKFDRKYFYLLALLIGINLIITNSLNVYVTICLLIIIKLIKLKKTSILSFTLIDITDRFISHRIELIKASLLMIKENFFFGVGLNNFIPNLINVSNKFANSWELQPVHNIFLLIFSEAGIIGFVLFMFLLFNLSFNFPLLAILVTGLSDHYWLTLQQNLLLLTYVVVISRKKKV